MSDRELLEMAAKAAGIEGSYFHSDNPIHCGIYQARGEYYWNPLISDSEALRLAVKLKLGVIQWSDGVSSTHGKTNAEYCEPYGSDPLAATRRAIVRAAAAIGSAHD